MLTRCVHTVREPLRASHLIFTFHSLESIRLMGVLHCALQFDARVWEERFSARVIALKHRLLLHYQVTQRIPIPGH